jgi:hypothetical protein
VTFIALLIGKGSSVSALLAQIRQDCTSRAETKIHIPKIKNSRVSESDEPESPLLKRHAPIKLPNKEQLEMINPSCPSDSLADESSPKILNRRWANVF